MINFERANNPSVLTLNANLVSAYYLSTSSKKGIKTNHKDAGA